MDYGRREETWRQEKRFWVSEEDARSKRGSLKKQTIDERKLLKQRMEESEEKSTNEAGSTQNDKNREKEREVKRRCKDDQNKYKLKRTK